MAINWEEVKKKTMKSNNKYWNSENTNNKKIDVKMY